MQVIAPAAATAWPMHSEVKQQQRAHHCRQARLTVHAAGAQRGRNQEGATLACVQEARGAGVPAWGYGRRRSIGTQVRRKGKEEQWLTEAVGGMQKAGVYAPTQLKTACDFTIQTQTACSIGFWYGPKLRCITLSASLTGVVQLVAGVGHGRAVDDLHKPKNKTKSMRV